MTRRVRLGASRSRPVWPGGRTGAPESRPLTSGVTLLGILAGVFDPPAHLPNVPLPAVGAVIVLVVVVLTMVFLVAGPATRRIDVLAALRQR